MTKIDFETHFYTGDFYKYLHDREGYPRYTQDAGSGKPRIWYNARVSVKQGDMLVSRLLDVGQARIEEMDEVGVDIQVLSLSEPSVEVFDADAGTALAKSTNDVLAEVIAQHPDRFMGLAAIAPQDPEAAVGELERAIKDLGFKGWLTHSNFGDSYLDDEKYWPILEQAEHLGVPIYIHPSFPAITQLHDYGLALAAAPFGYQFETAMCLMRMILNGVFDRYPTLKVILGHLGETLPFLMERIDFPFVKPWVDPTDRPNLERKPSEVLRENMYVTTSGRYFEPAFNCTVDALGFDHILLGTDYPYESMAEGIDFVENLPISQADRDKIYSLNARSMGIAADHD